MKQKIQIWIRFNRNEAHTDIFKDNNTDLDAVLEAVEFPAGITDLDTGLTNVD